VPPTYISIHKSTQIPYLTVCFKLYVTELCTQNLYPPHTVIISLSFKMHIFTNTSPLDWPVSCTDRLSALNYRKKVNPSQNSKILIKFYLATFCTLHKLVWLHLVNDSLHKTPRGKVTLTIPLPFHCTALHEKLTVGVKRRFIR
jgi:hypothetical protein